MGFLLVVAIFSLTIAIYCNIYFLKLDEREVRNFIVNSLSEACFIFVLFGILSFLLLLFAGENTHEGDSTDKNVIEEIECCENGKGIYFLSEINSSHITYWNKQNISKTISKDKVENIIKTESENKIIRYRLKYKNEFLNWFMGIALYPVKHYDIYYSKEIEVGWKGL